MSISMLTTGRHHIAPLLISILLVVATPSVSQDWQSTIVRYDSLGRLDYIPDAAGNRIPDFSHAGYKGGGIAIPTIPVVQTISPVAGDNTAHIQAAINQVGALTPGGNGFRGALLLNPGIYRVSGTITVNFDGVILRGSGEGADSTTSSIILGTGNTPAARDIIVGGGGSNTRWSGKVSGTQTDITDDTVYVGSRSFTVASATGYAVGDNIIIYHPCTDAWLQAVDYGGTNGTELWTVGSQPIVFNRYVTAIDGNQITVDVPVYTTLVKSLSQSYIYKYDRSGLRKNIGIERLRVDITGWEPDTLAQGSSAWTAIALVQIEDGWVKNCTATHFVYAAVRTETASRITVDSCSGVHPVGSVDPADPDHRRYNFALDDASQQVLMQNCLAVNGRHSFMSNGTTWVSGCVFYNVKVQNAFAPSEPHRRWSMGILYDNFLQLNGQLPGYSDELLGLYNRGDMGTGHGWAAAHCVLWNCNVAGANIYLQKPPTAQNYAIGCQGTVTGQKPPLPFNHPAGYIEGTNQPGLNPPSLYLAQLNERLGITTTVKSGNWSSPSTWTGGAIPTAGSNVVIAQGDTVTIDIATAECNDIGVAGTLLFPNTVNGRSLTVAGSMTIDSGGSFKTVPQTSNGTALVHTLTLSGDLLNYGGTFDMRTGTGTNLSSNTICAGNVVFAGTANSTVRMGTYSTTTNEFNAITFSKSGGGRVILQSNVVGNTASTVAGSVFTFTGGIVETGNDTLVCLATSSGAVAGGSAASYVIGNLGRGKSSTAGSMFFPIGDTAGYRPLTLSTSTTGMTTRHYLAASVVGGNANSGSSLLSGGIESVSSVRYYVITYNQGGSTSPSMAFYKFAPSYGADDGVVPGLQNLRVATSSDGRTSWIGQGPLNHTVNLDAPPTTITSDSLTGSHITVSDHGTFTVAIATASGGIPDPPVLHQPADADTLESPAVGMSWSAVSGSPGYWMEYASDSLFVSPAIDSTLADTVTTVTGLPFGHRFWWRVKAKHGPGWGEFSAVRSFTLYFALSLDVVAGWNLLSLPLDANDTHVGVLVPTAVSAAYGYAPGTGYYQQDSLMAGLGYWVKSSGESSNSIAGTPTQVDTIPVSAGWNIIGSVSSPVVTVSIVSDPPGMVVSPCYGYDDGGYFAADSLMPGAGYWIKSAGSGSLMLSSGSLTADAGRIRIQAGDELPPAPPLLREPDAVTPSEFALQQNYPNPFNPATIISYSLPGDGYVTLNVYNLLGQEVATLVSGVQPAGVHSVHFDAAGIPSGVYVYHLRAGTMGESRRMIIIK
jgi:hypothetical protein